MEIIGGGNGCRIVCRTTGEADVRMSFSLLRVVKILGSCKFGIVVGKANAESLVSLENHSRLWSQF